jgi:hypothetical protein
MPPDVNDFGAVTATVVVGAGNFTASGAASAISGVGDAAYVVLTASAVLLPGMMAAVWTDPDVREPLAGTPEQLAARLRQAVADLYRRLSDERRRSRPTRAARTAVDPPWLVEPDTATARAPDSEPSLVKKTAACDVMYDDALNSLDEAIRLTDQQRLDRALAGYDHVASHVNDLIAALWGADDIGGFVECLTQTLACAQVGRAGVLLRLGRHADAAAGLQALGRSVEITPASPAAEPDHDDGTDVPAELLAELRREFVTPHAAVADLRRALGELPRRGYVHIRAPGGWGKSTLLLAMRDGWLTGPAVRRCVPPVTDPAAAPLGTVVGFPLASGWPDDPAALVRAVARQVAGGSAVRREPGCLLQLLARARQMTDGPVILALDQIDELWTESPPATWSCVAGLLPAATQLPPDCYVFLVGRRAPPPAAARQVGNLTAGSELMQTVTWDPAEPSYRAALTSYVVRRWGPAGAARLEGTPCFRDVRLWSGRPDEG